MTYVIAFLAGFCVDLAYVWWVASIGRRQPAIAGLSSMVVGLCGLAGLIQALDSHVAAGCYLVGLGLGTATGVVLDRKKP